MELSQYSVLGIPIIFVIFGLVEFVKKIGVRGRNLTIASMVIGVAFGVLYQLSQMYPVLQQWLGVIIFGLLFGMAASGIYDFVDQRFPRR